MTKVGNGDYAENNVTLWGVNVTPFYVLQVGYSGRTVR